MVFSIAIKKVSRGQKINQRLSLKRLPAYVSRKSISSFESYQTQLVTIRTYCCTIDDLRLGREQWITEMYVHIVRIQKVTLFVK